MGPGTRYLVIFRLSQKLAKKIKLTPTESLPLDPNPYGDWSAHLFTADRTQYVLVTNTASLYSVIMLGRGITNDHQFVECVMSSLSEFMEGDGLEFILQRFVAPSGGQASFSKALNRSVTGSMNDMIQCAKMWLIESGLSLQDTSFKLNGMPMSALKYANPREAFKSMAIEGPASGNGDR